MPAFAFFIAAAFLSTAQPDDPQTGGCPLTPILFAPNTAEPADETRERLRNLFTPFLDSWGGRWPSRMRLVVNGRYHLRGEPPRELVQRRLNLARQLLAESGVPVRSIDIELEEIGATRPAIETEDHASVMVTSRFPRPEGQPPIPC